MDKKENKRYSYSTTGYGVFTLMGVLYSAGRIEVYDDSDQMSGYPIEEGSYWCPIEKEFMLTDFFQELRSDLPVYIRLGSFESCEKAVSEKLDVPIDEFRDQETINKCYKEVMTKGKDE